MGARVRLVLHKLLSCGCLGLSGSESLLLLLLSLGL
jgi:hypothetical protein